MKPIKRADVVKGDFVHQIKWDGIRGLSFIEDGSLRLYTRKGVECTNSYPELMKLPSMVKAKSAVLDGELVSFEDGRQSFYIAMKRNRTKSANSVKRVAKLYPVKYILFDIMFKDGEDLRQLPLEERQEILSETVEQDNTVALNENFEDGKALFELMRQNDMEGIVSKRRGSRYLPGKHHNDWYKTKTAKKILCAVIGVCFKNSRPASVMLGTLSDGEFRHIGNVSSGLSQGDISALGTLAKTQNIKELKDCVLIEPQITCWVKFLEWTHNGTLRHPVLLGFSDNAVSEAIGKEISI